MLNHFSFNPIAIAHTPFDEKFAIPRQANLAPSAIGEIEFLAPCNNAQAVEGLENISHIWLIFVFHQAITDSPKLKVRPPRLGGNQSLGVFSTRSPYRPNAIGQSLVKLESISHKSLSVSGLDLLNHTPILDIKPFVNYADTVDTPINSWAQTAPEKINVEFTPSALKAAEQFVQQNQLPLVALIQECLEQNPKPAYQKLDAQRIYGCKFWGMNVQFRYLDESRICVITIDK